MITMTRDQLQAAWVAAGKDKPNAACATQTGPSSSYDPELEKRRLDYEIRRYEERAERERQLAQEERIC